MWTGLQVQSAKHRCLHLCFHNLDQTCAQKVIGAAPLLPHGLNGQHVMVIASHQLVCCSFENWCPEVVQGCAACLISALCVITAKGMPCRYMHTAKHPKDPQLPYAVHLPVGMVPGQDSSWLFSCPLGPVPFLQVHELHMAVEASLCHTRSRIKQVDRSTTTSSVSSCRCRH